MTARNLVLMAAALLACGAAWGQTPKPSYEEALAAVAEAGCERSETGAYLRFFCEDSEALWYFSREGGPEHSAYFVAPAYPSYPPRSRINWPLTGGVISADSREHADELVETRKAWLKDVFEVWRQDIAKMGLPPDRKRSRLYPLEPS